MCQEWLQFVNFAQWAFDHGWERGNGLQLDRIDNDGNYEPGNCQFVTHQVNGRHKKGVVLNEFLVREIRIMLNAGERNVNIANLFGLDQRLIAGIKIRRSWVGIEP